MQLNKTNLQQLVQTGIEIPDSSIFDLPEKVLQFGTGVLLRGLPDYFIDKANKQGLFNGRIVVVKSTSRGDTEAFDTQDGLYTLLEQGVVNSERSEKIMVNASISKVLSATTQWQDIIAYAQNPEMQIIISNTTEVGISLVIDDATAQQPVSFPGRLLAFLKARYQYFGGSTEAGMVIIPTELILHNGSKLKEIVLDLAQRSGADDHFLYWLGHANDFCNSLVDRIVPGKPSAANQEQWEAKLGYTDELMIMSETYRLWAIETNKEKTRNILSFAPADHGVIITGNIDKFRELKLRLLNGTHTFSCGLARLAGFITVKEAMQDEVFRSFVKNIMIKGIVPAIVSDQISYEEAEAFALSVIDRFSNPYIDHLWLHICVQYSSKMAMRNLPLIEKAIQDEQCDQELMALGMAAYILYCKPVDAGKRHNEQGDEWNDDRIDELRQAWTKNTSPTVVVENILSSKSLWGKDAIFNGSFQQAVIGYVLQLMEQPALLVVAETVKQKTVA
jgi:tagaturonate reductase